MTVMVRETNIDSEIAESVKKLSLLDFALGAKTPAEYGKHKNRKSGKSVYDIRLENLYDCNKYELQPAAQEQEHSAGWGMSSVAVC